MTDFSFDRRAFLAGFRAIVPLALPGIPFGMVLGVVSAESGMGDFVGWAASWIILAGAANLAAVELLADEAGAAVVLVTVAFINSRHAMYSAVLRPRFAGFPNWFRVIGPYVLIDQTFALANAQPDDMDDRTRMWHYLGSCAFLWPMWVVAVGVGVLVGDVIDPDWQLTFTVPILFGGMMILSISDRPGLVAAVVAGVVAVLGTDLPQGSGVIVAILAGVTAAAFAERSRPVVPIETEPT